MAEQPVIPAEAVEAAAKVMHAQDSQNRNVGEFSLKVYEHDAREVLEAAAPHMHVPTAAEQALDRILITVTAVAAGQVPQDVAFTVIREISEHYTDQRRTP